VPVQPGSPGGRGVTTVPVPVPGWGPPAVAPPAPAAALPPAPVILPPAPPLHPGPYRVQRRSLAEMANEQLRRDKPTDPLADKMEGAGRDDCLRPPSKEGALGGLLAAPALIGKALSGNCPK
jgi:hypothetical protein